MTIRCVILAAAMVVGGGGALRAQEGGAGETTQAAATRPAVKVDPSDKAAVAAAKGSDVVAEGVIAKAAWSNTAKVMRAPFEGDAVAVVVFSRDRKALDEAFGGDVAAALDGARVRVTGKVDEFRGAYEVKVSRPEQLTIVEAGKGKPAATQPAQPTTRRAARQQAAEPAERE